MLCVEFKKWQFRMSLSLIFPNVTCQIKEKAMSHVTITVTPLSHVTIKALCRMSNLRKGCVALSILGGKGP